MRVLDCAKVYAQVCVCRWVTRKETRASHADDHSTAREDEPESRGERRRDGNLVELR